MRRGVWLLALAVSVPAVAAACGSGKRLARCPAPPANEANAYLPKLSSSSGLPGSTVSISARLPLFDKAGKYAGPGTPDISAYWNLDLDHWTSILTTPKAPSASIARAPVEYLGTHHVTGGCNFRMQVKIPSVRPGEYPLVFLYKDSGSTAANGPVNFRVTAG